MNITHTTQFEDHFPIPVMISHHTEVERLNQELAVLITNLSPKFCGSQQDNGALSGMPNAYGGRLTSPKISFLNRTEACVQQLRRELIAPGVEQYLDHTYHGQIRGNQIQLSSRAELLAAGDWQPPHMHSASGNLASGIYYAKMPDRPTLESYIEFLNPHPVAHHHGISLTRRLHPEAGDLLMFPPYYIHYTHPFKGGDDQTIVAFDVALQTTQFVF